MKLYIKQYELIFLLCWSLYIVYPVWALPVPVLARSLIYAGLILYFACSAYVMHLWFKDLSMKEPFIGRTTGLADYAKTHIWFFVVCLIASILHSSLIASPIFNLGDEALHIQGGLWVYDFLGKEWHKFLQIILWGLIGIGGAVVVSGKSGIVRFLSDYVGSAFQGEQSNRRARHLIYFILFLLLLICFWILKDISYNLFIVRYPPVSRMLYLIAYLLFGITHLAPRIIQLLFYLVSAFYIYRTINLFSEKRAALLGATLFLFSPPIFHYASNAQLTSGVIFFVVAVSFYFLKYLKDNNRRELLIVSWLIGAGFLYKEDMLMMFLICTAYVTLVNLGRKKRDMRNLKVEVKILLLSLVPVVPWMIMQRFSNWRSYSIYWKHLVSFDIIMIYFKLILAQVSWVIFAVFLISVVYILLKRRSELPLYYGFLFVGFYVFYTADYTAIYLQHRFSTIFYPSIAVFVSLFIHSIAKGIKWRHSFKILQLALTVYLIILSANPSMGSLIFGKQNLKFPAQEAIKWIKNNVKDGERILSLRIFPVLFYRDKYDIDSDKIKYLWYELGEVSTPPKLREYNDRHNITYIIFPYCPDYGTEGSRQILEYLQRNEHDEFIELEKFHIDDNFIYIYKIRE